MIISIANILDQNWKSAGRILIPLCAILIKIYSTFIAGFQLLFLYALVTLPEALKVCLIAFGNNCQRSFALEVFYVYFNIY